MSWSFCVWTSHSIVYIIIQCTLQEWVIIIFNPLSLITGAYRIEFYFVMYCTSRTSEFDHYYIDIDYYTTNDDRQLWTAIYGIDTFNSKVNIDSHNYYQHRIYSVCLPWNEWSLSKSEQLQDFLLVLKWKSLSLRKLTVLS